MSKLGLVVSLSRAWCLSFWFYGLRFTVYDIRFTDYGLQFMVIQLWAISFGTSQHLISFRCGVFLMTMQHRLTNIIFSTIMIWHLSPRRQLQSTSTYSSSNVDVSCLHWRVTTCNANANAKSKSLITWTTSRQDRDTVW